MYLSQIKEEWSKDDHPIARAIVLGFGILAEAVGDAGSMISGSINDLATGVEEPLQQLADEAMYYNEKMFDEFEEEEEEEPESDDADADSFNE